jgi:hypothetical protein
MRLPNSGSLLAHPIVTFHIVTEGDRVNRSDSLLALADVTERLRITGNSYVGVRSIPLAKIIGSVDRACEFDRDFRPQRRDSAARMRALETAFPKGDFPAISVFEVGGAYFISDGHHRVALVHERGQRCRVRHSPPSAVVAPRASRAATGGGWARQDGDSRAGRRLIYG